MFCVAHSLSSSSSLSVADIKFSKLHCISISNVYHQHTHVVLLLLLLLCRFNRMLDDLVMHIMCTRTFQMGKNVRLITGAARTPDRESNIDRSTGWMAGWLTDWIIWFCFLFLFFVFCLFIFGVVYFKWALNQHRGEKDDEFWSCWRRHMVVNCWNKR